MSAHGSTNGARRLRVEAARRISPIAAYRFIHAADIHLDSPLRSLGLRKPELAELIGNATRQAFVRVIDLCLMERVDALVLAGDLYDDDQTSMKTARFLADQMRRLHEAGIRVFVIRGNHDALSKITMELTFPDSVKVFDGRAGVVEIERARGEVPVAVHGVSFAKAQAPESLLDKYRPPVADAVNIGLMHTSLGGSEGHSVYAPCSLADLRASGFRYWALGHIHKRAVAEGPCTVVMPGMPQGRDINEGGPKSVSLVTIGDDRSVLVEDRVTSLAEFVRLAVDVTGLDDWGDLVGAIGTALERARGGLASDNLVARLRLGGTTPLAWRIRRDLPLLIEEADHRARLAGRCWVEKIEIECRAPGAAAEAPHDPMAELRRLIDEEVLGSEAFRLDVAAITQELLKQLPSGAGDRDFLGSDEAASRRILAAIEREGVEDVLARLHPGPGGDG